MLLRKIEALEEVSGVIIGHSFGGKSLGAKSRTGSIRIQGEVPGGLKGVMQSAKGLQEVFIRCKNGAADEVARKLASQGLI